MNLKNTALKCITCKQLFSIEDGIVHIKNNPMHKHYIRDKRLWLDILDMFIPTIFVGGTFLILWYVLIKPLLDIVIELGARPPI